MRKNILTSAFILGAIGAYASSDSFNMKTFPLELSNGETIEVNIQQEMLLEEFPMHFQNTQQTLSEETLRHEQMLQVLNQIKKVERELDEELPMQNQNKS